MRHILLSTLKQDLEDIALEVSVKQNAGISIQPYEAYGIYFLALIKTTDNAQAYATAIDYIQDYAMRSLN